LYTHQHCSCLTRAASVSAAHSSYGIVPPSRLSHLPYTKPPWDKSNHHNQSQKATTFPPPVKVTLHHPPPPTPMPTLQPRSKDEPTLPKKTHAPTISDNPSILHPMRGRHPNLSRIAEFNNVPLCSVLKRITTIRMRRVRGFSRSIKSVGGRSMRGSWNSMRGIRGGEVE
jgi:hypothetical protein